MNRGGILFLAAFLLLAGSYASPSFPQSESEGPQSKSPEVLNKAGDCKNIVRSAREYRQQACAEPRDSDSACSGAKDALARVCRNCRGYCSDGESGEI